jgi:hypothetical protein
MAFSTATLFNGHYYYTSFEYASYQTASATALSTSFNGLQGHLVTVTSLNEFNFLKTTFANSTFWIAASDTQSEGIWTWTAGPESGLVITPSFWSPGQPNSGTAANCAVMSLAGWDDRRCSSFLAPYVVEFECQSATSSTCSRMYS